MLPRIVNRSSQITFLWSFLSWFLFPIFLRFILFYMKRVHEDERTHIIFFLILSFFNPLPRWFSEPFNKLPNVLLNHTWKEWYASCIANNFLHHGSFSCTVQNRQTWQAPYRTRENYGVYIDPFSRAHSLWEREGPLWYIVPNEVQFYMRKKRNFLSYAINLRMESNHCVKNDRANVFLSFARYSNICMLFVHQNEPSLKKTVVITNLSIPGTRCL